jgi:predicted Zn-dependent protease
MRAAPPEARNAPHGKRSNLAATKDPGESQVLKAAALLITSLTLVALPSLTAHAQRRLDLPDFGTPADVALSKDAEAQLGRSVMRELRGENVIIEDPEITEYISSIGAGIASHANDGTFRFQFFVIDDDAINAFALPGGYIGVNTGLILETENESELAGVLAHEISHVTQRHIARSILDNQRTSMTSLAAMIAAVLLGVNDNISGDAVQGAVAASQSMAAQLQINFTRANEHEADRIGIRLLSAAGFDPRGMSSFFEKLSRRYVNLSDRVPPLLQTHPVSGDRVTEARNRVRQLPSQNHESSLAYALIKARLQVRAAPTPRAALALFEQREDGNAPADRYGLALAAMRMGMYDRAELLFHDLAAEYPTVIPFQTGEAEALLAAGATRRALEAYAEATRLFPRNVPLTISYAQALIVAGEPARAHTLLLDLLNNVPATPAQIELIARAANAEGDIGNAYFYMSYYYTSIGALGPAIGQLRLALESPNVNRVDRARFQARLDELIDYRPEEDRARVARGGPVPPPR